MHYVIVGNGVAGITAANTIRARDRSADITVISKEHDHFFSRTALMYVFCGQLSPRDVEPYERDHYRRMNFERLRNEVVTLDAGARSLKVKSGADVRYDRLLIASGSVARMLDWPGRDLDGVGHFVSWQEMEWLRERAGTARRVALIGGGLIGIEVAEILLRAGIKVHFIIREGWFWPIALNKAEGDMVCKHMEHHGCDVRLRTEITEILGRDGKVAGVKLNTGDTLDCDLAIFTIGVRPQTDWLKGSGLEMDRDGGIIVNDYLETTLPDVWAAGDCTSVVWFNDVRRPEQLWYTSRDQGRVAGHNLSGDRRVYKRSIFYNSAKFFDLEYTTAGYVNFNFEGEQDWYQREPGTHWSERITYLPDRSVIGFNMIGRRWDHRVLVRWVHEKRLIEWVLEHLREALFDEEFMPRFKVLQRA